MASIKDLVFDSPHPASAARFWAQALDDYEIAPYDDEELTRLRSLGIDDPENDPTVLLLGRDSRLPRIFFQRVPEDRMRLPPMIGIQAGATSPQPWTSPIVKIAIASDNTLSPRTYGMLTQ